MDSVGVVEQNADELDEIVVVDGGNFSHIQNQDLNTGAPLDFNTCYFDQISGGIQYSVCVSDIDNNGFNDLFTSGNFLIMGKLAVLFQLF